MPDMEYVNSSSIEAVGFDSENRELHIRFTSGKTYVYQNVDEWILNDLKAADSKGSYFNREIRDRFSFRED